MLDECEINTIKFYVDGQNKQRVAHFSFHRGFFLMEISTGNMNLRRKRAHRYGMLFSIIGNLMCRKVEVEESYAFKEK